MRDGCRSLEDEKEKDLRKAGQNARPFGFQSKPQSDGLAPLTLRQAQGEEDTQIFMPSLSKHGLPK
jgi:hypothetical protein